mmetsp:Transcript_23409/g.71986  ORF Transcript_23409/g.71986 Transcript_23409/m.71986 type:complete len:278 (-) Transcript_23409:316-1149(-)
MRALTLLAALLTGVDALVAPPSLMTTRALKLVVARRSTVEDDVASPESSSEDSVVVSASPKDELLAVVQTAMPVSTSSESTRSSVLELLSKLEPANPTEAPATSPLLNGCWAVAYTGYAPGPLQSPTRPIALALYAGGYTPGLAGLALADMLPDSLLSVGELTVTVSRDQPRVEASTTVSVVGAGARDIKIQASLEAETAMRLKETYDSFELPTGGKRQFPAPLKYQRKLYVTYLDDELLVARDDSGVPSILLRKALPDWFEGVPSTDDDDLAPGAG